MLMGKPRLSRRRSHEPGLALGLAGGVTLGATVIRSPSPVPVRGPGILLLDCEHLEGGAPSHPHAGPGTRAWAPREPEPRTGTLGVGRHVTLYRAMPPAAPWGVGGWGALRTCWGAEFLPSPVCFSCISRTQPCPGPCPEGGGCTGRPRPGGLEAPGPEEGIWRPCRAREQSLREKSH